MGKNAAAWITSKKRMINICILSLIFSVILCPNILHTSIAYSAVKTAAEEQRDQVKRDFDEIYPKIIALLWMVSFQADEYSLGSALRLCEDPNQEWVEAQRLEERLTIRIQNNQLTTAKALELIEAIPNGFVPLNDIRLDLNEFGSENKNYRPIWFLNWVSKATWIKEADKAALLDYYKTQLTYIEQKFNEIIAAAKAKTKAKIAAEAQAQAKEAKKKEQERLQREIEEQAREASKQEEKQKRDNWIASLSDEDFIQAARNLYNSDYEGYPAFGEAFDGFFKNPRWIAEQGYGGAYKNVIFSGVAALGEKNANFKIIFRMEADYSTKEISLARFVNAAELTVRLIVNGDLRNDIFGDLLAAIYLN
jgi:hypothetical protein